MSPLSVVSLAGCWLDKCVESRYQVFTDAQWQQIERLLPSNEGRRGHPFGDGRRVVEGIAYRYRTGIPWRICRGRSSGRGRRYGSVTVAAPATTWDRVLAQVLGEGAEANRAHRRDPPGHRDGPRPCRPDGVDDVVRCAGQVRDRDVRRRRRRSRQPSVASSARCRSCSSAARRARSRRRSRQARTV
jgi:hypothetical protein